MNARSPHPAFAPVAVPAPPLREAVRQWLQAHAPAGVDLRIDSRQVARGDVFLALPGRRFDGLQFLAQAHAHGASAALVDEGAWAGQPADAAPLPLLPVPDLAAAAGWIAQDYYRDPSTRLRSIGITGTNGKTSSCQWIAQLLGQCGLRCAALGTLGYGFPGAVDPNELQLTTPDAVNMQRLARRALDQGARALATEVSSIGLDQGRVDGFSFHVALFTNLTRDHLDYHADMAAYGDAKRRLFAWPSLDAAVLNLDDEFGRRLAAELAARVPARDGRRLQVIGVASDAAAGRQLSLSRLLVAEAVEHHAGGMRFCVASHAAGTVERVRLQTGLIGEFNVVNLLGVLGVAGACGIALSEAAPAVPLLQAPPGRLQRVVAPGGGAAALPLAVVDYAHTPDAIAKALQALRPLAQSRGGRLCIVFGAGGERDPGKRPVMAAAAAAGADRVVLTSDNPRGEPPETIIEQLVAGLPAGANAERQADRACAIELALQQADGRDVVLIAGKGHEPYQEIAGQRLPFSDAQAALAALRRRAGEAA
jgi:UDP-N-acetylmuramoyl-L-alanyl-D-glutamate--2,6-diaminopimelate ligase